MKLIIRMGRKKSVQNGKENNIPGENNQEKKATKNIASDAKRSIVAIVLFAVALLVVFSFFGVSGVVGKYLDKIIGISIGWIKWVFPIFLALFGIVLLFRKETSFYVIRLVGFSIILLSLTGFVHWFFEADKMAEIAKQGKGGGYAGFFLVYVFEKLLGSAGSMVVIVALFFIGIIVSFNFSIFHIFSKFKREKVESGETEDNKIEKEKEEEKKAEEIKQQEEKKEDEKEAAKKEQEAESNIGRIEFVEGRDQYVSPSLLEESGEISIKESMDSANRLSKKTKKESKTKRWQFPPMDILEKSSGVGKAGDVEKNAEIIEKTLRNFGIEVERGEIKIGPSVTQYSFRPAVGIKISKILSLQNDLSLALAAHPIRIEAPIPGKSLIGIEVPNKVSAIVRLRGLLEGIDFRTRKSNLTLALGQDVSGNFIIASLDKMPHLMIAGATGTGKSVCINSIITTLLYQNSPEDLKFIMIDPKRVELSLYNDIPHLLTGVVVENGKVINVLRWAVSEMERRYRLLQDVSARDITSYKQKIKEGKKRSHTNPETGELIEENLENLPYIVIVVDELADLMASHGKEVEGAIVRIAQMARAVGIHLIISTQRPSVEVITGLIKANVTSRIAFQVATQIDSRTILDMAGAEKLLGNGDMLYLSASAPKPKRIQGVFVSESEVVRLVKFLKSQKKDVSSEEIAFMQDEKSAKNEKNFEINNDGRMEFKDNVENDNEDKMYELAKTEIIRAKKASASFLQRRLRIGYARAARLLDILEERGIIGPADGAKPREVYINKEDEGIAYDNSSQDQKVRDKWQI